MPNVARAAWRSNEKQRSVPPSSSVRHANVGIADVPVRSHDTRVAATISAFRRCIIIAP
jgi:hypothetical protein